MASRKKKLWRTRKDFERDLFASYRISKFQFDEQAGPMGSALIGYQKNKHKITVPKKLATALSVLDDLILDAVLWHHSFAMLILNRPPSLDETLLRSLFALHMKLAQDSMVVRNLINSGFDTQAKNLLRSIDEHASAICYLCVKPEAAKEFVDTKNDDSANRFWWKHIRGCRKIIEEAVGKVVKNDIELKKMRDFRSQEREILSEAHHPSYLASTFPFMIPYGRANVTMYMFGFPSELSYRTGKLLFYILAEVAILGAILNKTVRDLTEGKDKGFLQETVESGRAHLGIMAIHLSNNWNAPIFATTRQMKNFLKTLPADN